MNALTHFGRDFWHVFVIRPVLKFQKWRCRRAREYLLTHDAEYREIHLDEEITRKRQMFYGAGGSPTEVYLPDRWTMEEELPPMSWPH